MNSFQFKTELKISNSAKANGFTFQKLSHNSKHQSNCNLPLSGIIWILGKSFSGKQVLDKIVLAWLKFVPLK